MISELVLVLFVVEASNGSSGTAAQTAEQQAPAAEAPAAKANPAPPAPAQAPAPAPTSEAAATRDTPEVKKKVQNPHVPPPFGPNTTNPSLDSGRSTVIPDRDALPQEFQDIPLAPLGPAPPDTTPTQEGGGARRVNEIKMPSPTGETPAKR